MSKNNDKFSVVLRCLASIQTSIHAPIQTSIHASIQTSIHASIREVLIQKTQAMKEVKVETNTLSNVSLSVAKKLRYIVGALIGVILFTQTANAGVCTTARAGGNTAESFCICNGPAGSRIFSRVYRLPNRFAGAPAGSLPFFRSPSHSFISPAEFNNTPGTHTYTNISPNAHGQQFACDWTPGRGYSNGRITFTNTTGSLTISGTPTEGQTLNASNVTDADGITGAVAYQWKADGTAINGATTQSLLLSQNEVGKVITVQATYKDNRGRDETPTSAETSAITNVNDAGAVAITGTASEGETLTATVTDTDGATGSISYQWKADGADISGATGNTYDLTQSEVGKVITVEASYTDDQGTAETPVSAATSAVTNINNAGVVAITGTASEGETLTATVTDTDGATGSISYQWKADGADISGATGNTYDLTQNEVGKVITVQASYTDDQGTAEAPVSAATSAVTNVNNAGTVAITGTASEGETLTATVTDTDGATDSISYQWKADGTDISGATSNTYDLTQSEVGKVITVQASYTDDQGTAEAPLSAATSTVTNVNNAGAVAITGITSEGETLTATVTDTDGATGSISYQWKADGADISGATSNTYDLTQSGVGTVITVQASYTDDQGTAETPVSAATATVTNVNNAGGVAITGTASEGETLTATVTDTDGATGSISYQWKADGVNISGATSNTYDLTQNEVDKVITAYYYAS